MKRWMVCCALWAPGSAWAQSLVINFDTSVAEQYGVDTDAAESDLTTAIDEQLNVIDQQAFLQAMADAAAWSTKGMGVDYTNSVKRFVVGASFGSAVNGSGLTFSRQGRELPSGGFSLQVAVMTGINLGFGVESSPLSRFKVFVHGFTLRPSGDLFDAQLYNGGVNLQIDLVKPQMGGGVGWGGLAVTTGYEYSGYALTLTEDYPIGTQLSGQDVTWQAQGDYTVRSGNSSVPVELSTSVKILILSVYMGAAGDVNIGAASSDANLAGDLELEADGDTARLGDAALTLADEASAQVFTPRGFFGAQVNILPFKVYGQLNLGINQSFGGHVGARLAF